ncbi:uncharacterized protein LOC141842873 [Curcuma longa]|uniref:uncharacterized protein LOC141842873 n=1 Tax=Curcuma longa TaxID=136217 RepID=UPI003D9F7C25
MNLSRAIAGVLSPHSRRSPRWLFSLGSSFTAQQLASISSSPLKSTSETITEPKPEASSPGLSPSPATEAPVPPSLENYEKSSDLPLPKEIPFQPQIHDQMHLAPSPGLSSSPSTEAPAPPSLESYKKSSDLPRPKEIPFQPQIHSQMHPASSPGLSSSPATEAPAPPSLENYKKSVDLPRPKSIFFQPQILNQMHLVGYVGAPVQLQMLPNGSCVAVSVITSKKIRGLLSFRIPVIFEGDLAQIAACHLKENDLIYVAGQLSGDAPSVAQEVSCTNIQLL